MLAVIDPTNGYPLNYPCGAHCGILFHPSLHLLSSLSFFRSQGPTCFVVCSHPSSSILLHSFIEGRVDNKTNYGQGTNAKVNPGDEWSMEVDLRSKNKEERTLHWFVRGKQENVFIKGLPEKVQFCVWNHSFHELGCLSNLIHYFILLLDLFLSSKRLS